MDYSTILAYLAIACLLTFILVRISKAQIKKKSILIEISNATMDFDKIDGLKNKNLSPKYLLKIRAVEQLTIEAKFLAEKDISEMVALYNRTAHLPDKSFRKSIENQLTFAIRGKISELEKMSSPEGSEIVLKNLPILEKASKNITAEDIDRRIKKLEENHKQCSEVRKETKEKLAKTHQN